MATTTYLTSNFGSGTDDGVGQKSTHSVWIKRTDADNRSTIISGSNSTGNYMKVRFGDNDRLQIYGAHSGSVNCNVETKAEFRDISGWYHVVLQIDTSNSTASERIKWYVNGELQELNTATYPSAGSPNYLVISDDLEIGRNALDDNEHFDGTMSHFNATYGTVYAPTAFGETDATTGEWKIKTSPSVTYGTYGFFILKDGNSVTDQSGEGNNFTVGGGTLTKTEDNPSNVFATLNPLDIDTALSYTFAKGNTDVTIAESGGEGMSKATLGVSSGKYYFECKLVSSSVHGRFGVVSTATPSTVNPSEFGIAWQMNDATMQLVNSSVSGSWGSNPSNNDILMFALDCDNQAFYFGVNGTWRNSGNPTSGASRTGGVNYSGQSTLTSDFLTVGFGGNFFGGGGVQQGQYNFGNGYFGTTAVSSAGTNASGIGIFEYDVPTGYTALSTKGLNL